MAPHKAEEGRPKDTASVEKESEEKRPASSRSKQKSKEKAGSKSQSKERTRRKAKSKRRDRKEKEEAVEQHSVPVEEGLNDEETAGVRDAVAPVVARFLLMNKTFPAISSALVDRHHPFVRTCTAFLAKCEALASVLEDKPAHLLDFLREELWTAAREWYHLTDECRGQVLAAEAVESAVALASHTLVLPALEIGAHVLASQPQLRNPQLRAWLAESSASHKGESTSQHFDHTSFRLHECSS